MNKTTQKEFVPVMLTPFKEDGQVDYQGLARLTEYYLESGAKGLFANCLSSEMYELTNEERLKIVGHVVDVANGEVPVVATGGFGSTIVEHADCIKRFYDKGIRAVIMITSLIADEEESATVFEDRVCRLLDLTNTVPLGFYECPVPYKRIITPEQLERFVRSNRVFYHKDTCLDIRAVRRKLKLTTSFKDFGLYDAYLGHAVDSLQAGSAGLSCIQGNFFPELIVWLCEHYENPNVKEEREQVAQFFIDNMEVMHHVYPVISKYFLQKRGLQIQTYTRRQVGIYTKDISAALDQLIEDYKILIYDLGLPLKQVV